MASPKRSPETNCNLIAIIATPPSGVVQVFARGFDFRRKTIHLSAQQNIRTASREDGLSVFSGTVKGKTGNVSRRGCQKSLPSMANVLPSEVSSAEDREPDSINP
jgi:hypothetical protein